MQNIALENYRGRFYETCRGASQDMQIHHAVPQVVQRRYPTLLTESQLHSLSNLRGIPNIPNTHSIITTRWNAWLVINTNPTLQQVLDYVKEIDDDFGHLFIPPIR